MGKIYYIDASNHVAGKLSTFVAKSLKEGNKVVVVHCERVVFTGPIKRGMKELEDYLNKQSIVNPLKGQKHYKEPSKYFKQIVRRMLPRKKTKDHAVFKRLKTFEGCPEEYFKKEFFIAPKSLISFTADPKRKFYFLGDMLRRYGWQNYELVEEQNKIEDERRKCLEAERKLFDEKKRKIMSEDRFIQRVNERMNSYE